MIDFIDDFTIECIGETEEYVYDIEIEDNHNFFGNGILVHNSMYLDFSALVKKFKPTADKSEIVEFVDKMCDEAIKPFLDKVFLRVAKTTNAFKNKMNMKREAIADRGVWTGKKRYILNVYDLEGVRFENPEIKITGLEAVRSSVPGVCRERIKDSIKIIMSAENADLIKFISDFRQEFYKLPYHRVSFPSTVRGMAKYYDKHTRWKSGTPAHVKGALIFNEMLEKRKLDKKYPKIKDGDSLRFCYMKQPNPTMDKVFAVPDELPEEFTDMAEYIDYPTQFQKTFLIPLSRITDVIGWETEHRATLDIF